MIIGFCVCVYVCVFFRVRVRSTCYATHRFPNGTHTHLLKNTPDGQHQTRVTTAGPLVLAAGDATAAGTTGHGGDDDKTAFAAELQAEVAATQVLAAVRRAREGPGKGEGPGEGEEDALLLQEVMSVCVCFFLEG